MTDSADSMRFFFWAKPAGSNLANAFLINGNRFPRCSQKGKLIRAMLERIASHPAELPDASG